MSQRGGNAFRFAGMVNALGEIEAYTEEAMTPNVIENPHRGIEQDVVRDELPFLGHSRVPTRDK